MELYPSRLAAAAAAGISKDTWRRVEEGLEVQEAKLAKVDKALGWTVGSCVTVAEGGEPLLADRRDVVAPSTAPLDADELRRAAFEAARVTMPMASIGDLDAFSDQLVEVLRRAGSVKGG
ncbi:hypothetical protein ACIRF8_12565 [Streptomyces sp. NPDC102406]|uniref:hypothetical protein n=1 Tax=Streptomyces sp. NPDC102406 TaxID=3366171 RepID=UPI003815AE7E